MASMIYVLEEGKGYRKAAEYSLPPKQALVAFIKQTLENNFNTWDYPETVEGMRESSTIKDHWYYDVFKSRGAKMNATIAAYPLNDPNISTPERLNKLFGFA